jgi:hypothetical protein
LIALRNTITAGIESLICRAIKLLNQDKGQKTKDLILLRNTITAGIESFNLHSNQMTKSRQRTKDKGQKTKDLILLRNRITAGIESLICTAIKFKIILNGNILRPKRLEELREDR